MESPPNFFIASRLQVICLCSFVFVHPSIIVSSAFLLFALVFENSSIKANYDDDEFMDAQLFNLMIIIIIYITTLIFQVLFIIIIIIILIIILIVSCVRVSLSNGYFDSIPLHSKYKFNIVHVASFFLSFLFSAPFDSNHHHSTRISSSLQLKVCIIIITPLLSSSLSQQLLINCSSIHPSTESETDRGK